jgi:hypothetical protein
VVSQLGIERKDLRNFRDISEYRAIHKNETPKKVSEPTVAVKSSGSISKKTEDSGVKKSIYNILYNK